MKKSTFFVLCLGLMASLTSCFDDRDIVYSGDPKVEFANPNFQLSSTNGFASTSLFISGPSIGGAMTGNVSRGNTDSLLVQLVGPQRSEALDVFYEVDAAASTAVEGTHYTFRETKGKVTIPANSSFGYIKLSYPRLAAGSTGRKTLTMKITGTSDSKTLPSENYKTFYATIFPAHTYKGKTLGAQQNSSIGSYFASVSGNTYNNATAAANATDIDVSYAWSSKMLKKKGTTIDSVAVEIPVLVAPSKRATTVGPVWGGANLDNPIGATAKSATYKREGSYSSTTDPEAVTRALNGITDSSLSGFTATSASNSIEIKENESYSFINAAGKKGLIRIRKINPGATGSVVFDVIVQP